MSVVVGGVVEDLGGGAEFDEAAGARAQATRVASWATTSLGRRSRARAMVEHEVHHRGQIYIYLGMLGVKTPPIYGLTSEEVKARSQSK